MKILTSILSVFWIMVKPLVILVIGVIGFFILIILLHIIAGLFKGRRFGRSANRVYVKQRGIFARLFYDFPHRLALDLFARDPEFFKYQGCVIFCGRQGMGKTISMVQAARKMREEYRLAKCITNLAYTDEDAALEHWTQLIDYKNGKHGVIVCMDEMQNWFSSNQSRNFPPEMLQVITQNRKNRRIIMGTSQNFYLLAKAIRSQATEVRDCLTICGCLTFVRRREPFLNAEGDVEKWRNMGTYFFVHDKQLRDSYDTYKVIESLSASGFKDTSLTPDFGVNVTAVIPKPSRPFKRRG